MDRSEQISGTLEEWLTKFDGTQEETKLVEEIVRLKEAVKLRDDVCDELREANGRLRFQAERRGR